MADEITEAHLDQLRAITSALPGVSERISHGAPSFFVGKRPICYYHNNHRGDGRVSLMCPIAPELRDVLMAKSSTRFYQPQPSARGTFSDWLGVRLDTPDVKQIDWLEIRGLLEEAFRHVAPKYLIAEFDAAANELRDD